MGIEGMGTECEMVGFEGEEKMTRWIGRGNFGTIRIGGGCFKWAPKLRYLEKKDVKVLKKYVLALNIICHPNTFPFLSHGVCRQVPFSGVNQTALSPALFSLSTIPKPLPSLASPALVPICCSLFATLLCKNFSIFGTKHAAVTSSTPNGIVA